ncbi:MAG: patatin-like phospholipase family protein [Saprospiraceae bacterium]|nr:patatin-like phospholipase family protein [Saprospiraceae bacterium]
MRIGLCLSGGGTRGIFHIGVLQALEEYDIKPDIVAGSSAGALVGSFFCAGISPKEMLNIALSTSWFHFFKPKLPINGLTGLHYLGDLVKKYISHNSFDKLKIPLRITATNLNTGLLEVFESGELSRPVRASCSVPMLFKPVMIGTQMYLDGGILMNLPATLLRNSCDFLIGSSLFPLCEMDKKQLSGYIPLMSRCLELSVNSNSAYQKQKCDLLIETDDLSKYGRFDFKSSSQVYQLGYETASRILSQADILSYLKEDSLQLKQGK